MLWPMYTRIFFFASAPLNIVRYVADSTTYRSRAALQHHVLMRVCCDELDVVVRECREQPRPVETRAGIGLATGCDVAVRGDVAQRECSFQTVNQLDQARVLSVGEGGIVRAFELDADREIVAPLAAAPARDAGMPGAARDRHELHELAVAPHEEVRRDAQLRDLAEIRVRFRVEAIGEEALDRVAAVLPRRQADRV